jgi:hypothetical protein
VTLFDHVKPLLFVAPHDVYLIEKRSTNELLVIHGKAVWLAISNPRPNAAEAGIHHQGVGRFAVYLPHSNARF